jgi:hypothetical protein
MRFSIEQAFLTDSSGKPLGGRPAVACHVVEADTLDAALSSFLGEQQATLVGSMLRFPGSQAVATAQQQATVFTIHVLPESDLLMREKRSTAEDGTRSVDARRDSSSW